MPISKVIPALIDTTGATPNQFLRFDGTNPVWQTVALGSGAQISTQVVQTSTVSATQTLPTFPFVVGQVFIEYVDAAPASHNTGNVLCSAWVNLRSYSGTKTADVSNRYGYYSFYYNGSNALAAAFRVNRTTSGTVVTINIPRTAIAVGTSGTSAGIVTIASYADVNWNNSGYTLRVTAIEDTQS